MDTDFRVDKEKKVASYLSFYHFDDDNKVYKTTDFYKTGLPPVQALAVPAESMSTAVAFCTGALTSAFFFVSILTYTSWEKRTSSTALRNPLIPESCAAGLGS